jgi:hypothetical protein
LRFILTTKSLDLFDEYTRRQYLAKAPERNPFGDEEEPLKFNDLDVFTRIRVLHQLSNWTFFNVDRIRGMMPENEDHLDWRMEPLGWDKEDRAYYVLDDNRLYRRTDEPVPPPTPKVAAKKKGKSKSKAKSKSKTPQKPINRGTRASKRIKVAEEEEDEVEESEILADEDEDVDMTNGDIAPKSEEPGFGFTSKTWECVAVTLVDYQEFLSAIFRSRDPNEKILRTRIEENVLPILEKRAESIRQKKLKKIRELENLSKLATAKRSGRLADKAEKEKQERDEREAEEKRRSELKAALAEQERQRKIEEVSRTPNTTCVCLNRCIDILQGHESRRLTREQRVRERETKRILHEEELLKLEEEASRATSQDPHGDGTDAKRLSERNLKTQKEQHQKELDRLAAEDDGKWYFDCSVCGLHGDNLDDGTHSVACDRCSVWQHSKCHGFTPKQAEKEGFVFVCATCKRKEEDAAKPKIPSLKLGKREGDASRPATANGTGSDSIALHGVDSSQSEDTMDITNGPSLSPAGQTAGPPGQRLPPVSNFALKPPQEPWQGSPLPPPEKRPSSRQESLSGQGLNGHAEAHQNAHQAAVASAGGHNHTRPSSAISSSASPQRNLATRPFSPAAASTLLTPQHNQFHPQLPPSSSTPGPQLLRGFQSPIKQPPPQPQALTSSPPNSFSQQQPQQGAYSTPQQRYTPSIQHERSPQLHQSPKTDLPPPPKLALNSQQAGISPVKSSPAAAVPGSQSRPGSFVQSFSSTVTDAPVLEMKATVLPQTVPVKREGESSGDGGLKQE